MESIYAALLLYKASKDITEASIEKILKAAEIEPDKQQITKLVAGLNETDINSILQSASTASVASMPATSGGAPQAKEKEAKKEEKEEEAQPARIGSLF